MGDYAGGVDMIMASPSISHFDIPIFNVGLHSTVINISLSEIRIHLWCGNMSKNSSHRAIVLRELTTWRCRRSLSVYSFDLNIIDGMFQRSGVYLCIPTYINSWCTSKGHPWTLITCTLSIPVAVTQRLYVMTTQLLRRLRNAIAYSGMWTGP